MFAAPNLMMGGKGPLKFIIGGASGFTTAGAAGINLTLPAATLPGDLIITVIAPGGGVARSVTPPSDDWVEVLDTNATPPLAIYWKYAVAGDAGAIATFLFSNTTSGAAGGVLLLRNAKFDKIGIPATKAGSAPDAPSINASKGMLFAVFRSSTASVAFTAPIGMAVAAQTLAGAALNVFMQNVDAGATGVRSSVRDTSGQNIGVLLSVTRK